MLRFDQHVRASSPKWRTFYTQSSDGGKRVFNYVGGWGGGWLLFQRTEWGISGLGVGPNLKTNGSPGVLAAPSFCFWFSFSFYRPPPRCQDPSNLPSHFLSFPKKVMECSSSLLLRTWASELDHLGSNPTSVLINCVT